MIYVAIYQSDTSVTILRNRINYLVRMFTNGLIKKARPNGVHPGGLLWKKQINF